MASVYQLDHALTAHAWSPDATRIAVCENQPDVFIYSNVGAGSVSQWKKEHILQNHTMVVVGIDWSQKTNKLVTCSHDINAFVWTYDQKNNKWEPKLSILRISRAALSCRWSPDGSKFAVATASKVVPVCYYEGNQDWWVSKMIKKHRSTVIDVAWHPSSQLVATASSDFKCRVFSAFIAKSDANPAKTVFGDMGNIEFGTLVTEFEAAGGWIEAVTWAPSGHALCFAGHDSTISFVSFAGGNPVCTVIRTNVLPFTCMTYLSENTLAAAGYGFEPMVYQKKSDSWQLLGNADSKSSGKKASPAGKKGIIGGFVGSKKFFEKRVREGVDSGAGTDKLTSTHHNTITDMCLCKGGFSTSAGDGRIAVWDKGYLQKQLAGISL